MTDVSPTVVGGGSAAASPRSSTNLGDILERVLDKGLVIAGDIQVNLLDIELLTVKLRLVIASLDTAEQVGINWWKHDPWLSGDHGKLEDENRRLRARITELEEAGQPRQVEGERVTEEDAVGDEH